jgi:hypothetical protein
LQVFEETTYQFPSGNSIEVVHIGGGFLIRKDDHVDISKSLKQAMPAFKKRGIKIEFLIKFFSWV